MKRVLFVMVFVVMLASILEAGAKVTFVEPERGFFCDFTKFCFKIDDRGVPATEGVTLQWREMSNDSSNHRWHSIYGAHKETFGGLWCARLDESFFNDDGEVREDFYSFRVEIINEIGEISYSEPREFFYDATPPVAYIVKVSDGVTEFEFDEYARCSVCVFPVGTDSLIFTFKIEDRASALGPSPLYNSGVDCRAMALADRKVELRPVGNNEFTYVYSGLGGVVGEWPFIFFVYDVLELNYTTVRWRGYFGRM